MTDTITIQTITPEMVTERTWIRDVDIPYAQAVTLCDVYLYRLEDEDLGGEYLTYWQSLDGEFKLMVVHRRDGTRRYARLYSGVDLRNICDYTIKEAE